LKTPYFYQHQYGFRSKHSTTQAVLNITSSLYDNLNDKILSCLAMIDLKKAFDTVSHEILTSSQIRTLWNQGNRTRFTQTLLNGQKAIRKHKRYKLYFKTYHSRSTSRINFRTTVLYYLCKWFL